MLCVVAPLLHTFPVAMLLVSVVLVPAQKELEPVINGTGGDAFCVITLLMLEDEHPAAFVTVTE